MSAITEYLKLIPKAIQNPTNIIQGVINSVKLSHGDLPEDEQSEIIRRRLICDNCPFLSSNAVSNPALNYKTDRFDEHCILCGCNKDLKTAALDEECGISHYNDDNPNNPMPLKWEKYKKPNNE